MLLNYLIVGHLPGGLLIMRNHCFLLVLMLAATGLSATSTDSIMGTIKVGRANLRIRPGTKYAVVATVERNDRLAVLGRSNDWYRVELPANATVWVAASFLAGQTTRREVNLRCGPGVMHESYGTIPAGTAVTCREERTPGWQRIVPPPGLSAWISAELLELDQPLPAESNPSAPTPPGPKDPPPEVPATVDNSSPAAAVESDSDAPQPAGQSDSDPIIAAISQKLPIVQTKAKEATFDGILLALDAKAVHVTHSICVKVNEEYYPLCYLHADRQNLKLWEGQRVRVSGRQFQVVGWQKPMLEVLSVTPLR